MKDYTSKIKRQSEILGLIINPQKCYTIQDLADKFNCEELTIKRDLQELRMEGIAVHSSGKKGVKLQNDINSEKLTEILSNYASLTIHKNTVFRATKLFIKKHGLKSLSIMTMLQAAIGNRQVVEIDYKKPDSNKSDTRVIEPQVIYESENSWRMLATHNGILKQFVFNRILDVKETGKIFNPIPENEIDALFANSFRSWTGKEEFCVKLKFMPPWAERYRPRILIENQKITDEPDGNFILEMHVNSLNEVASWVVSRGKGVKVLEPEELKNLVIELAEGAVGNYDKQTDI